MGEYSGVLNLSAAARRQAVAGIFEAPERRWLWRLVTIGERVAALLLLLLLAPLLVLAGLLIWRLSHRPPLVAHRRVGRYGEEFWVVKFRTMWGDGVENGRRNGRFVEKLQVAVVPEAKRAGDPRVTSGFAAFCRKYSIDELPQLYPVLRGKMSLVGPRPLTLDELSQHYGQVAWEVLRFRPGITGLWQVRGRSRLNYRQRRRLDLFLVRNWSFRLYLWLLLATVPRVLRGADAW